jgi:peptidoglycan/xylan/chitin deacetylase (PgdA/CDA1 family)
MHWPNDSTFAVCLTHDVDRVRKTYQYVTHLADRGFMPLRQLFQDEDPYWNFEAIMQLEDKFSVRSTFFFLQESQKTDLRRPREFALARGKYKFSEKKVHDIIHQLDRNEWEIALHGSYKSYKDENLLQKEKNELEMVLGRKVLGVRQHYLNLDVPQTWRLQKSAGFAYDASFGWSHKVGFRDGRYLPFCPFSDSFWEIPLAIMDGPLLSRCGDLNKAWTQCLNLIDAVERRRGLLTVLWHQRVFNEDEFPGWSRVYERILSECADRACCFATCRDVYNLVSTAGVLT